MEIDELGHPGYSFQHHRDYWDERVRAAESEGCRLPAHASTLNNFIKSVWPIYHGECRTNPFCLIQRLRESEYLSRLRIRAGSHTAKSDYIYRARECNLAFYAYTYRIPGYPDVEKFHRLVDDFVRLEQRDPDEYDGMIYVLVYLAYGYC